MQFRHCKVSEINIKMYFKGTSGCRRGTHIVENA